MRKALNYLILIIGKDLKKNGDGKLTIGKILEYLLKLKKILDFDDKNPKG